jgi:hypothetical protein
MDISLRSERLKISSPASSLALARSCLSGGASAVAVVAAPLSPLAVELVLFLGDISILLFWNAVKYFVTAGFVCGDFSNPPLGCQLLVNFYVMNSE